MNWKHTVILGGALLLLAACNSATAPISQLRDGNVRSSTKAPSTPDVTPLSPPVIPVEFDPCRSGITLSSGRISMEPSVDSPACSLEF
jgi:hypothetical protein